MKTIHLFILFIIVALIQIYIPSAMILNQEATIDKGKAYKFKTRPIDPNDPFRGKYITLDYEIQSALTRDSTFQRNTPVYVYIKEDSLGYAKLDTLSKEKLNTTMDYVIAKTIWQSKYKNQDSLYRVNFSLPFNRYYMEESKAYDAELAVHRRWNGTIVKNVYSLVYLKDGNYVLDNVFIDDMPIKAYVEQHKERSN